MLAKKFKTLASMLFVSMMFSSVLTDFPIKAEVQSSKDGEFTPKVVAEHDFENNNLYGWVPRGGAGTVSVTGEAAHTGSSCLKMSGRTKDWHMPRVEITKYLEKEAKYRIELYVKLPTGTSPRKLDLTILTRYVEGNQTRDVETSISGDVDVTADAWAKVEGEYVFDPAAAGAYVYPYLKGDPEGSYIPYLIDDFKITMIAPAPKEVAKTAAEEKPLIQTDIPSLKEVCAPYFEIGAAVEPAYLLFKAHDQLLKKHFNCLVAENVMKPISIQPSEGNFTWDEADKIVKYAQENKMKLRFHTLVWHSQVPDCFFKDTQGNDMSQETDPVKREANKKLLLSRLEKHIRAIVARYGDKVDYWDVVNEVIDPSQDDGMRRSKWYLISGKDYIKTAFRVADDELKKRGWRNRAKLYINDYNTHDFRKSDCIYDLILELKAEGIAVDGVGHQTHISLLQPPVEWIVDSIRKFGEIGLDNQITELDVNIYRDRETVYKTYKDIPRELIIDQGYRYQELFDALKSVSKYISNVTFWGMADDHTWLSHWPVERANAPLPFDIELKAKPAYWGIVDPSKLAGMK